MHAALARLPRAYLQSSTVLMGWMAVRAIAQAATVLLLARAMGADAYGIFVAAIAVAALVSPLAGLGVASIVLRNGAMDPGYLPAYLRRAFRIWVPSAAACILGGLVLASVLLPRAVPWPAVVAALLVEVIVASLSELLARHAQAQRRMGRFGAMSAGPVLLRLAGLALLVSLLDAPDAATILWTHAATGVLFVLIVMIAWPRRPAEVAAGEPRQPFHATAGLPFALAAFATRIQGEFNKPVLARVEFALAGNFNVGQRAVEIVALPLAALQESLWPRLYALDDPRRQLCIAGGLLVLGALACGALVWSLAPWLPRLMGADYLLTAEVVRLLAWLPMLQVVRGMANFMIIHGGRMRLLGWAYSAGAGLNVLLVAALVPAWGMHGAVAATYATELLMIFVLISGIRLGPRP
jgi:O-antigen/teichoic acid export membrane protein